jgi:Spy/CpxP family protein refolding chaperone
MKKVLCLIFGFLLLAAPLCAQPDKDQQNPPKFSPEQFDAELHQFIIKSAGLTQQEAEKFFPVYKEMQKKQRTLFMRQRHAGFVKPADENECMKMVQQRDNIEVELKRIQQSYHNKFFDILPASKVYDIIQAEDKFHRTKLRQWGKRPKPEKGK